MQRQFKPQALTAGGTPQPVLGTTTTAAVGPVGSQGNTLQSIPVADSSLFIQSDWIVLDPLGANPERLLVLAVVDSTHIKTQDVQFTHGSGVFVQLAVECAIFTVQGVGAHEVYIGTAGLSKSAGPYLYILQPVTPPAQPNVYQVNLGDGTDSIAVDDFWFDGTTADTILPSLTLK